MHATVEPEFRSAFTTSFIFHGVIFLALIFGLPHMKPAPLEMSQPIAIDIVDVGPVTTTQVQGTGQVAKKNDLAPAPLPAPPPKPAARPAPAPPSPTPPKPTAKPAPDDQAALNSLLKSESKKVKTEKPTDKTDQQFGSLLKNLSAQKPDAATPADDSKTPPAAQAAAGAPGIVSDKLTISEADALRRQIEQCWNMPTGARDAQNLIIEIHLEINPDRTVKTAEIVNTDRMGDPFFRAAAESARRAVLNPKCSPLALPEGQEALWHSMTMRFNPQDML